jgi:hypothetical protein
VTGSRITNPLSLPVTACELIVSDVRRHGAHGVETGAFLLAHENEPDDLNIVAFSGVRGITRRPHVFRISGSALERLFEWASEKELRVRALVHSHKRGAFLSATDLRHGLSVRGFTSAVIPKFAEPSPNAADWGWWRFNDGSWEPIAAPRSGDRPVHLVEFDESGVHER